MRLRRSTKVPVPPTSSTREPPTTAVSFWWSDLTVGTPVFGAPDGTAGIWRPPAKDGGGGMAPGALGVVGREATGLGTALGAVELLVGALGGGGGAVVGDVVVGCVVGVLSANAVSAPAPANTTLQARVVSNLRVRIWALHSIDPSGIRWWRITRRDDRDREPVVKRWQRIGSGHRGDGLATVRVLNRTGCAST
ncbi:hypothetical protein GCM10009838_00490 [Catenulispora subtropica]|uniref:Uncharacterized protein n=1 Tax=Catenulispora subtropica TaxID=450798 RepID=A0ABP5BQX4_9ACTN